MTDNVEETLRKTLNIMEQTGFKISQEVKVVVNEKLPIMGYTSRKGQSHVIVVSGFALKSPVLEGLLTHELTHIYRNTTNHPSHSEPLIAELLGFFIESHRLNRDYEQGILRQVVNHIQDLYADDIAIKVLATHNPTEPRLQQLGEFFLGWIKEEPSKTKMHERDQWINASILLNNCFAISNMERHEMPQSQIEKVKSNNSRFLNQIKPTAAKQFDYFNKFMVGLKEDISEAEFRKQMTEYLGNFLNLVGDL